jgi:hypothetical protein
MAVGGGLRRTVPSENRLDTVYGALWRLIEGFGIDLKIMVIARFESGSRHLRTPCKTQFFHEELFVVELLPPQCHPNWLGEYPAEGVQSGLLHAGHEVPVDIKCVPHRGMLEHLGDCVYVGAATNDA